MTYLIIAEWDQNNIPTKIQIAKNKKAVDEWFKQNSEKYPNAIYGEKPESNRTEFITVDPTKGTFFFDVEAESSSDIDITRKEMRKKRDFLLSETDWTQLPDSPLGPEMIESYKLYRQSLRNIPQDFVDGRAVIWPDKPS